MARGGSADRAPDWESKLNAYRSQCKVKGGWAVLYERSERAFTYQPPLTFHWLLYAFIANERNLHWLRTQLTVCD